MSIPDRRARWETLFHPDAPNTSNTKRGSAAFWQRCPCLSQTGGYSSSPHRSSNCVHLRSTVACNSSMICLFSALKRCRNRP
jgi:hypothetical protein